MLSHNVRRIRCGSKLPFLVPPLAVIEHDNDQPVVPRVRSQLRNTKACLPPTICYIWDWGMPNIHDLQAAADQSERRVDMQLFIQMRSSSWKWQQNDGSWCNHVGVISTGYVRGLHVVAMFCPQHLVWLVLQHTCLTKNLPLKTYCLWAVVGHTGHSSGTNSTITFPAPYVIRPCICQMQVGNHYFRLGNTVDCCWCFDQV